MEGYETQTFTKNKFVFRSLFTPNRTLDTEQVSLDCWVDVLSLAFGVAIYGENEKQDTNQKKKDNRKFPFYEWLYNGLMTDLNLSTFPHAFSSATLKLIYFFVF